MGKRISVIIPTKGRSIELRNVIASLRSQSHPIDELVIVDDSSATQFDLNEQTVHDSMAGDGSVFPVRHVKGHGIGMTEARNHGADISEGDIISFLDDDVVLDPDYYRYATESFEDPEIAGFTGMIMNPVVNSRIFHIFSLLTYNSITSSKRGYMRRSGYPCYLIRCSEPTLVGVMSGCNMSFVRNVFLMQRSDEKLIGYSYLEDADLTHRVSISHKLVMDPRSKLLHNTVQKTVGRDYYRVRMAYHRYLFKKNMGGRLINWIPFAVSAISDLFLVCITARKNNNYELITAALNGLMRDSVP